MYDHLRVVCRRDVIDGVTRPEHQCGCLAVDGVGRVVLLLKETKMVRITLDEKKTESEDLTSNMVESQLRKVLIS